MPRTIDIEGHANASVTRVDGMPVTCAVSVGVCNVTVACSAFAGSGANYVHGFGDHAYNFEDEGGWSEDGMTLRYITAADVEAHYSGTVELRPEIRYVDPYPKPGTPADYPEPSPDNLRQAQGVYRAFWTSDQSVVLTADVQWHKIVYDLFGGSVESDESIHYVWSGSIARTGDEYLPSDGAASAGCSNSRINPYTGPAIEYGMGAVVITVDGVNVPTDFTPANVASPPTQAIYDATGFVAYVVSNAGVGSVIATTPCGIEVTGSGETVGGASWPSEGHVVAQDGGTTGALPLSGGPTYLYGYSGGSYAVGMSGGGSWLNTAAGGYVNLLATKRRIHPGWHGAYESVGLTFKEGGTWNPFSLTRAASLAVDDMTGSHPSGNQWSGGTVSGGYRVVTGAASIHRDLKCRWQEIMADPGQWWNDHDGVGTADEQRAAAYIEQFRVPYNVRRRLDTDDDYCCWADHRWLKITARMADGQTGTFDLRVHYHAEDITDDYSPLPLLPLSDPNYDTGSRQITDGGSGGTLLIEDIALTDVDSDWYVDLAWLEQTYGALKHVTGLTLEGMDTGKEYRFKSIKLVCGTATDTRGDVTEDGGSWGYWTGIPYADDYCVIPVSDGRVGLPGENGTGDKYGPRYVLRNTASTLYGSPRGADYAILLPDLIEQIWAMGDCYTPVAGDSAPWADMGWDSLTNDYAFYLDAGWHASGAACSATWKTNSMQVANPGYEAFSGTYRGQGRLCGIAWNMDTDWPKAGLQLQTRKFHDDIPATDAGGDGGDGTVDGTASNAAAVTTDANGAFSVASMEGAGLGYWEDLLDQPPDNPSTPAVDESERVCWPRLAQYDIIGVTLLDASSNPAQGDTFGVVNRGLSTAYISGIPEETEQPAKHVSLSRDRAGLMLRGTEDDTAAVVERRSLPGGIYTELGRVTAKRPAVWWGLSGRPMALVDDDTNVKVWDVEGGTLTTLGSGKYPQAAANAAGMRAVTYWRGGKHYARVYDGQGNDLHGENAVNSAGAEGPCAVAWLLDGGLEAQYSDGTNTVRVTSDTGEVWA